MTQTTLHSFFSATRCI